MAGNPNVNVVLGDRSMKADWKIPHFFKLPKKLDYYLESDDFIFSDLIWYFSIYPNGESSKKSGWISLYLNKELPSPTLRINFTIGIKRVDGSELTSYCSIQDFEHGWGTKMLIQKSRLHELKNSVSPDGSLRIFCRARLDGFVSTEYLPTALNLPLESSLSSELTNCKIIVEQLKEELDTAKQEREAKLTDCKITIEELKEKLTITKQEKEAKLTDCKIVIDELKEKLDIAKQEKEAELTEYKLIIKELKEKLDLTRQENQAKLSDCKISIEKLAKAEREKEAIIQSMEDKILGSEIVQSLLEDNYKTQIRVLKDKLEEAEKEKKAALAENKVVQASKSADYDLSENLKEIFQSGYEGDITLQVKDRKFLVHKVILAARSSVFRDMLQTDMANKNNGIINIEDCESGSFEDFLCFLYCGQFDIVTPNNAFKLCLIADKYNVKQLKESCFKIMIRDISTESVCDALYLASLYDEQELLNVATNFFIENMCEVICTPKWIYFLSEHPTIANKLFLKMTQKVKK